MEFVWIDLFLVSKFIWTNQTSYMQMTAKASKNENSHIFNKIFLTSINYDTFKVVIWK